MMSDAQDADTQDAGPSNKEQEDKTFQRGRDVVTTTDSRIENGRSGAEGRELRPDETIVAETSRITRAVPNYAHDPNAFVEPERAGFPKPQTSQRDQAGAKGTKGGDRAVGGNDGGEDRNQPDDRKEPVQSGRPGWINLAITGVLALVCGLGGAWAFSYFDSSKPKDPSPEGGKAKSAKKAGGAKEDNAAKGHAKGQASGGGSTNDSGSEIPGFTSAEDADTLKTQIEHLSSRFDTIQQRVESISIPRNTVPPDLGTLQIKMGELTRSVDEIAELPSRSRQMESRLDRLQEEVKGLRERLAAEKDRGGSAAEAATIGAVERKVETLTSPAPLPSTSVLPADPSSPDDAMAEGIALFKRGLYPQADDIFRKLQLTRPQDARVWYYSALAHGFTTGQWDGDTRRFVVQGAERERAGFPSTSQIDTAFAGLNPAQGKDWLASYRSQLIKH